VDADVFVRVIHVPQLVVDGDRLDLSDAAESAEPAHERGLHPSSAVILQAVLREVVLLRTGFRRDDGEDRSVRRAAVEADPHRRAPVAGRPFQNRHLSGRDVAQRTAIWRDRVDAQTPSEPLGQHRDVGERGVQVEPVFDVDVVGPIGTFQKLPQCPVHAEHSERAVGRCHLHRPEHEALRRVRAVDPDRRIVGIARQRVGRAQRRHNRHSWRRGRRTGRLTAAGDGKCGTARDAKRRPGYRVR
jgi:hypothetical protein